MMSDNPKGGSKLSGMPTKQKITMGIVVVVIAVLLWQIIGLFTKGGQPTTVAPHPTAMAPNTPSANPTTGGAPMAPAPAAPVQQKVIEITATETEFVKSQQELQEKYVNSLNELQMLRIQREIAETSKDIAAAKLATVTAEKSMVDLLTKPVAPAIPVGVYSSSLTGPGGAAMTGTSPPGAGGPPGGGPSSGPPARIVPASQYVVISVAMKHNTWRAVIGYEGKLFDVAVNDVLSPDGSKVAEINRDGVVLEKDGQRKKISLLSSV